MIAIYPNDYDFTSQCFQHCHCWQTDTEIKSIPEEQVQITVIKARVMFDLNTFDYFIHKYTIQQMCCSFENSFDTALITTADDLWVYVSQYRRRKR